MRLVSAALVSIMALFAAASPSASAQAFPTGPITFVVPFAPGGATDAISRIFAEHMSGTLGQPVVVENSAGAGGTVGSRRVMRAEPNGYTILMGNLGTHAASLALFADPGYDPRTDFKPVGLAASIPMFVATKKSLPVKNFREFAEYMKARPGKLNYGTAGIGSTAHLTCLFMEQQLGTRAEHVPFPGSGPALSALLGEHIDFVCDAAGAIVPQIQSGAVNGLVVTGRNRVDALPNMPTSAEAGFGKFIVYGWNIIFAPKGTPDAVMAKLSAAVAAAIKDPQVQKKVLAAGAELPRDEDIGPKAAAAIVKEDIDRWIPLMKGAGVQAK
jgi:tripartite-type tricarboxylate transporter receptor subunit TctC